MQTLEQNNVRLNVSALKYLSLKNSPAAIVESEQDAELILECARLLEQLYPDKVMLLCRKHHWVFQYAGGNSIDLWGYTKEELESFSLEDLLNLIHPDDRSHVLRGLSKLHEFAGEDPAETKFVFTYRVKTSKGDYIVMHDEKVCVRTTGGTYAYFNIYSKSSDQKCQVTLAIFKRMANNRMIRINEFTFTDKQGTFSSRELDIVKLLDKGLDNLAIANALSLSIYTIKNHKQKMFRKANAKNSLELARFARTMNLI